MFRLFGDKYNNRAMQPVYMYSQECMKETKEVKAKWGEIFYYWKMSHISLVVISVWHMCFAMHDT